MADPIQISMVIGIVTLVVERIFKFAYRVSSSECCCCNIKFEEEQEVEEYTFTKK